MMDGMNRSHWLGLGASKKHTIPLNEHPSVIPQASDGDTLASHTSAKGPLLA